MRTFSLVFLLACHGTKVDLGEDTGRTDADTDTDTDADADTDADTGETGDTGTTTPAPIADIVVDCNGGADFVTIQEAIDAATSGDRIGVEPCEYHERIHYRGKTLDVFGIEGSAATEIDGDATGTVVNVEDGEIGARFAGFTLDDGLDTEMGGAVEVTSAELAMEDVVIKGTADSLAIVYASNAWLDLTDVVIVDNDVPETGQAIYAEGGSFTATRLTLDCDDGAYGIYQHNATILTDSEIACANGYGLYSYHGEMDVVRSRIAGGPAAIFTEDEEDDPSERQWISNSYLAGEIGLYAHWVDVRIENSVIAGTDAGVELIGCSTSSRIDSSVVTGAACGVRGDGVVNLAYSDFWGNTEDVCDIRGTAAYTVDPGFVDYPDDLHLTAASDLVDAGNPQNDDVDGTRNDVGMYGGPLAF